MKHSIKNEYILYKKKILATENFQTEMRLKD